VTPESLEMFRDILIYAKTQSFVADYKIASKHTLGAGTAYYDRIRASEFLIKENFVEVRNGRFFLGDAPNLDWLERELAEGDLNAWELAQFFPQVFKKFENHALQLSEIGLRGELFVISELERLLQDSLFRLVRHVSKFNDVAGYDVFAPSTKNNNQGYLLEIKTTTRPGTSVTFFLSRNEYDVGLANKNWRIVVVEISQGKLFCVGHLDVLSIQELIPVEVSDSILWTNLQITINKSDFLIGLP
jgi:hypothetical protein